MDHKLNYHLSDLLDIRLAEVTPKVCRERHELLTRTSGKSSANGCLRILKAVWNDAARVDDSLPENPVSRGVRLNRERPRDWALSLKELPGVWQAIDGTKNPIRRVAWTFLLLTGVRSHDCRSLRWQDIDDG
jgi:integrase